MTIIINIFLLQSYNLNIDFFPLLKEKRSLQPIMYYSLKKKIETQVSLIIFYELFNYKTHNSGFGFRTVVYKIIK